MFSNLFIGALLASVALAASGDTAVQIHPNGNSKVCLDVTGNEQKAGTPVQIFVCNDSGAQNWVISINLNSGNRQIRLQDTNLCLDGSDNFGQATIQVCVDRTPTQSWSNTPGTIIPERISLADTDKCLDNTGGLLTNGNPVQTVDCRDVDFNQLWTT